MSYSIVRRVVHPRYYNICGGFTTISSFCVLYISIRYQCYGIILYDQNNTIFYKNDIMLFYCNCGSSSGGGRGLHHTKKDVLYHYDILHLISLTLNICWFILPLIFSCYIIIYYISSYLLQFCVLVGLLLSLFLD